MGPKAECFYCFEVFGIYDETRSTSFWYGFSKNTTFPWDMNNANVGCCLKSLFGCQCMHSYLCERWQLLLKKSLKAVLVAQKLQKTSRTCKRRVFQIQQSTKTNGWSKFFRSGKLLEKLKFLYLIRAEPLKITVNCTKAIHWALI